MYSVRLFMSTFFVFVHRKRAWPHSTHRKICKTGLLRFSMTSKLSEAISENGLQKLLSGSNGQFVFIGGKGGVGKTSTSSALALKLSDAGYKTLVVSTDPAHSLGDALDMKLSPGVLSPVVTERNLWALEIDAENALKNFKETANELDIESLAKTFGVPKDILQSFGLDDMASIFSNPPPGIDEIVSLIQIFEYADGQDGRTKYDRVVIDTAPTGHTVRLLQVPNFLNSVIGKLIVFQSKISRAVTSFKGFFGGGSDSSAGTESEQSKLLQKLEKFQNKLTRVKSVLADKSQTQFVIVTIPTVLAVTESTRLVESLKQENVGLSTIICNQVVSSDASSRYLETRRRSQLSSLQDLRTFLSDRYNAIEVTEVPYFDTEVTGIYGLRFFASVAHRIERGTARNPVMSRKLAIFGGKGGVGKTTSAASWAVQLADCGMKTLVVSTDPAHSLGDAFQEKLTGTPRLLDATPSGGQLWAMEVDPVAAVTEFKGIVRDALGGVGGDTAGTSASGSGFMDALGLGGIKDELVDLVAGVEDPPPGTDEIVALTRIIGMLENGYATSAGTLIRFDRVVLDTAPTGHTLRMLTLPVFLKELVRKVRSVRDKSGGMLNMGGRASDDQESTGSPPAVDRLGAFEARMDRLQQLLHSPADTEFAVVTIPTEVAVAETKRLIHSLAEQDILCRRLIVNQVIVPPPPLSPSAGETSHSVEAEQELREGSARVFLNRLRENQRRSIDQIKSVAEREHVPLLLVPYYELETRTVYGLRAIGNALFGA